MADPEKAMEVVNNDDSGEEEEVDGSDIKANVAAELLKNPALFSALQGKLNNMVGMNSGYIAVIIIHFQRGSSEARTESQQVFDKN